MKILPFRRLDTRLSDFHETDSYLNLWTVIRTNHALLAVLFLERTTNCDRYLHDSPWLRRPGVVLAWVCDEMRVEYHLRAFPTFIFFVEGQRTQTKVGRLDQRGFEWNLLLAQIPIR